MINKDGMSKKKNQNDAGNRTSFKIMHCPIKIPQWNMNIVTAMCRIFFFWDKAKYTSTDNSTNWFPQTKQAYIKLCIYKVHL